MRRERLRVVADQRGQLAQVAAVDGPAEGGLEGVEALGRIGERRRHLGRQRAGVREHPVERIGP